MRLICVCRNDLTPDMSGVVWLYFVSPFPKGQGDFIIKVAIDVSILKSPLRRRRWVCDQANGWKGKGLLRSIRHYYRMWG